MAVSTLVWNEFFHERHEPVVRAIEAASGMMCGRDAMQAVGMVSPVRRAASIME